MKNFYQLYTDSAKHITKSIPNWQAFLIFSTQLHKYSFPETVQLYPQNQHLTMLADFGTWKKINRSVKKGEKSVVISRFEKNKVNPIHLFDVSQTVGEKLDVFDWKITEAEAKVSLGKIYEDVFQQAEVPKYFALQDLIAKGVYILGARNQMDLTNEVQEFIEDSVLFSMQNRFDWLEKDPTFSNQQLPDLSDEALYVAGSIVQQMNLVLLNRFQEKIKTFRSEKTSSKERMTTNEETVRTEYEREESIQRSLQQPSTDRVWNHGSRVSASEQSDDIRDETDARRTDGFSTQKRSMGDRDGNRELQKIEERSQGTNDHQYIGERTTQQELAESSKRDNTRNLTQQFTDKTDELESGSFQYLKGHFAHNQSIRFTFNSPTFWLDVPFVKIGEDYACVHGFSASLTIEEQSSQQNLVKITGSKLITSNLQELYTKLKEISEGTATHFELEKELFLSVRQSEKSRVGALSGSTLTAEGLRAHTQYLAYLDNPDRIQWPESVRHHFHNNPYLIIELIDYGNRTFIIVENRHAKLASSKMTIHATEFENPLQGFRKEKIFEIKENPEQQTPYEFDQFTTIFVPSLVDFTTLIYEKLSSSIQEVQALERKLLLKMEGMHTHILGEVIEADEEQKLRTHLNTLFEETEEKLGFMKPDQARSAVFLRALKKEASPLQDVREAQEVILPNEGNGHKEESAEMTLFDFIGIDEERAVQEAKKTDTTLESLQGSKIYYPEHSIQYAQGKRGKAEDNLLALAVLQELTRESQSATSEQQEILSLYSGWGGIPEIFDEANHSWQTERERLKQSVTDLQYKELRASVLTAFYTSPELINEIYQAVEKIGDFSNGRILDPAMGTGNFFQSMPKKLQNSDLVGIELDPITANIAKQLYPNATIKQSGFENLHFEDKVHLIVGNFPFNNIKVLDKKYDKYNFVVHDYFMAKSIDLLEQKGLMIFITSAGSMDKKDRKAREYLARRGHLIGAVRLPKTAFKQSAGTEVISDILIFQKKTYQEMVAAKDDPSWLRSVEHPEHPGLFINAYFLENPQNILGIIQVKNFHGQTIDILPHKESDLQKELHDLLDKIVDQSAGPSITIEKQTLAKKEVVAQTNDITVPADVDKYSFFVEDQKVFFHTFEGTYQEIKANAVIERVKKMVPVRQAVKELLDLQQYPFEEADLQKALENLNQTYDAFVRRFGYFNDRSNMTYLREDLKFPLLLSLEKETEVGYIKQPIFYKATVRPVTEVTEVTNGKEALMHTISKFRKIDFAYMQSIYPHQTINQILAELSGEIYLNPTKLTCFSIDSHEALDAWEIADEFLTGHVKDKLDQARLILPSITNENLKSAVEKSIEASEKAQPERLLAGDIKFQIGSPWIPTKIYDSFMHHVFETPNYSRKNGGVSVDFLAYNASFRILNKSEDKQRVLVTQKYGTSRINGYEILEASLNLQQVTIKDREVDSEGKVRYVLNPQETMIAREKQQDIEVEFQKWLFSDQKRANHLLDIYNDRFNTSVPRTYKGENLRFEGMNLMMELRPHQKDVIARILFSGKALMAHEVGAGKTAAMLSAGMYLKQNGLINKPLYVVPNHLTEQWGKEILTFYPNANILITTKKDFEKKNRQEFVAKIATGDYDAVIIGHSQFERIPLSKERQQQTIELQIEQIEAVVRQMKEDKAERWSIKQIERFKVSLKTTLEKLNNESKRDEVITFEELGVDFIFVDEAHVYKNLFVYTKMQNVAGVGSSRSQRASDMFAKVRYIQEEYEGENVVFATGTPVSNSMSELYVMQYFLQPEELNKRGLTSFDAWAATFGQVTSSLEITPEGSGYRMRNRFSKFHNLPELMGMFHTVADIQTADMLNLPVPKLDTGEVQTIVIKRSAFQEEMMDQFVTRSEAIRNKLVDPAEDNMLKLTGEAKLMAIDSQLIDPEQEREPESKLSICSENVFGIWEKTSEAKSTQIIFSDSGTPHPERFNVYDEIKAQLIDKGIPKAEIAFIHDAKTDVQRDKLFEKVRNGEVRVILGSTQKLGTGTNIQDKLIAAHHIDCPWKPSDLTQREGRILRQGNENDEVEIFRYVTKGTFDSYLWQIQEQKLTYISQVMNGHNINRSMDDLDETVLSASEVKAVATDNPLLAEKMAIDNHIVRLQLVRSQFENTKSRMDQNIRDAYPNKIIFLENEKEKYTADMNTIDSYDEALFLIMINDLDISEKKEAFEHILALSYMDVTKKSISVGMYRGLEILIERQESGESLLVLQGEKAYRTRFSPETGIGNITRLINLPNHIKQEAFDTEQEIANTKLQLATAKREIEAPFKHQAELDSLLKKQHEINQKIEFQALSKDNKTEEVCVEV